ncbi:MAG TPA: TetR/AcrR family transcriptional regulator [Candidatus Dormibacteraeota bacterium]|nr:TetR/AcrR family transcriptional regulator [Candidatus Dormibacteraeota bacterium]
MPSGKATDLIWSRPEPGARRPRLSRRQIAETALAIADAEGFAAVSMRRLASELDAGTMTLYHYVRNKDELVALMDDAHMAEELVPKGEMPEGWREAMGLIARRTRASLMRHPWALEALRSAQMGPNALRHFEQSLQALSGTDLDARSKFGILAVVDDFVFGNVLRARELVERRTTPPEVVEAITAYATAEIESGSYPQTQALMHDSEATSGLLDTDGWFELGLEGLLDGIARRFGLALSAGD